MPGELIVGELVDMGLIVAIEAPLERARPDQADACYLGRRDADLSGVSSLLPRLRAVT
jgi:hypothetical protein